VLSPLEALEIIWCNVWRWGPQLGIVAERKLSLKLFLAPASCSSFEAASAWLIVGFDVHVSASGSAAMGDAVAPVDLELSGAGTLARLGSIEDWMLSVSQHLREFKEALEGLAARVTALESQVQAGDRGIPVDAEAARRVSSGSRRGAASPPRES